MSAWAREESGQMAVELAVLIPVIVVVALIGVVRQGVTRCGDCPWRLAGGRVERACGGVGGEGGHRACHGGHALRGVR